MLRQQQEQIDGVCARGVFSWSGTGARCCLQYSAPPPSSLEASGLFLGPFVIPGRAVCVSVNQSPVDHVSRRHQRVLRSLEAFCPSRRAHIRHIFRSLYFPSGRPWALSASSQKHFENTSLENSIFSRPLTASSKVLPRV